MNFAERNDSVMKQRTATLIARQQKPPKRR